MYNLCCNNGGVFIKAGQHVGALDYLLPTEYVETMKVLHNDAPCSELEDIKKVVEEDLGSKVNISEAKSIKIVKESINYKSSLPSALQLTPSTLKPSQCYMSSHTHKRV